MVICDEALLSEIEAEVYTLENVRIGVDVDSFPHLKRMDLYLVLTHYHPGEFEGTIYLVRESSGMKTPLTNFPVEFTQEKPRQALYVHVGVCRFPACGGYRFEVWFADEDFEELQKGERRLEIYSPEVET